jgi:DAK2 domain fusion protein YloV
MTEAVRQMDGNALKQVLQGAVVWFETNHETVNQLNVFPVPDGDTGTNMLLTLRSACQELDRMKENNAAKVVHALAHGALMGARGNSGVILSQILRGLARGLKDQPLLDVPILVDALQEARDTAYRGVVKPVEGTILTVIKDISHDAKALPAQTQDLLTALEAICQSAHRSVERTPELLPVLKQAKVVDSGGFGLETLFDGMLRFMRGESLDTRLASQYKPLDLDAVGAAMEEVEPGQDWEVIVDFRPYAQLDLAGFYQQLETLGTSIQVGEGEELVRMHIHLPKERRYEPIEYIETLGVVVKVHLENLLDQMEQQMAQKQNNTPAVEMEEGQIVAVVISPGKGFDQILPSIALGPVALVSGGQTMNPSTQDILSAFEHLPTERVIILPNNKNIQLAAQQAAEVSAKQVLVIPTRTIPQGIAALTAFESDGDLQAIADAMQVQASQVDTGEVTIATRTVNLDGVAVQEGQIIGIYNGKLVCSAGDVESCVRALLNKMGVDQKELITLYYGADTTGAQAEDLVEKLQADFSEQVVETYFGGQPHYFYLLSVE